MNIRKNIHFAVYCVLISLSLWTALSHAASKNGFPLNNSSIPINEIFSGGPPKDGIPAIETPKFVTADKADFLADSDRVLAVVFAGVAKAYPLKILNWHEVVNDSIGEHHFVVTFCPLCGTGMVFDAAIENSNLKQPLNFGVSGLLYNNDVLLYDRNTESLWSQIKAEAMSGKLQGSKLKQLPALHTSWQDWRSKQPNTLVLSTDTGSIRNYNKSPYADYTKTKQLYFNVSHRAPKTYHPKEQVIGLEILGSYKAYPFKELSAKAKNRFVDKFQGKELQVYWNEASRSAYITDMENNIIVTTTAFWFAWFAFHPDTEVYKDLAGQ